MKRALIAFMFFISTDSTKRLWHACHTLSDRDTTSVANSYTVA
jgi:hypothetical protein